MPTCLSCYKHFKLKASDDPNEELCRHCVDNYVDPADDWTDDIDSATRLDIENMLNPSGRTPARFTE